MAKLKVCGHCHEQDVKLVHYMKEDIDYVGFIFTPQSQRHVQGQQVAEWLNTYPGLREKAVGVFLDQEIDDVIQTIQDTGINIVQLHGHETSDYCQKLRRRGMQVWKVVHMEQGRRPEVSPYLSVVNAILLDTKIKGQVGGTGQTFDWGVIPDVAAEVNGKCPLFIAGGVTSHNANTLVAGYTIDGVDVASGSETNGYKDKDKISALITSIRAEGGSQHGHSF
ncbi:phosphoribosylanthranilate isomerase [Caldalkalibacillus salinus]|uniref:phosphoribosylanthranilate isomerase n=1 Tax=Caldalkalibacillus salinus TaxID=2803787 RepID=UPI0019243EB7|nr:phosphoribosylanthranilate isomerase [Caldalkalibacillus salinus]